ncbi:hypothetical protein Tco_0584160 [Tanacetum coccineum]
MCGVGRGGVDGEGDGSVERVVDEWQLVVLVLAVGGSEAGDDEGGMMMMMMEVGWRASVVVATVVAGCGCRRGWRRVGDGSVERVVDEWQLVVLVLAVGGSEAGDDEGGMMMMMMEVGWHASVVVATVVAGCGCRRGWRRVVEGIG